MSGSEADHSPRALAPDELQAILDSVAEGIVTLDQDGRVMEINQAACEILEVRRPEVTQTKCCALFGEQFCNAAAEIRESVSRGKPVDNVQARLRTTSGVNKMLSFRSKVLPGGRDSRRSSVLAFRDVTELVALRDDLSRRYRLHNIVGKSKPMQEIFRLIDEVADSDASVLIEGESGTGKELVARAIHHLGPRANGPFTAVNCSALAEGVLESELFGHVEGAFTGATRDKRGRFEIADRGTIFLDEIGDLAPAIQVKLLRVLQDRTIERVGSHEPTAVDIRVVAATHRPLAAMVADGKFRQDLYYRLRVVPIHLPPLRQRRDDLPLLAQHFVERFREETGRPIEGLSPDALTLLLDYPWPGNVRELENAIEYAFVKARSGQILPGHLPPELRSSPVASIAARAAEAAPFTSAAVEDGADGPERLHRVLQETDWNVAKAARRLGISRTTLYARMRQHGLARPR